MVKQPIEQYWEAYLATLPSDSPYRQQRYVAEQFGDTPDLATQLALLILKRIKTATCSALWEWEAEGTPLPQVGLITIVLDGSEAPLCIIETIEVKIQSYHAVDAEFASDEGEGDRSLDYWREAHWRFFSRTLVTIGRTPTREMPLVCERFRLIYP
jgi:uncharacterized protein YhfF